MYGLAVLFFNVAYRALLDRPTQDQYVAGAVLLGSSPCTAMVFVWSRLAGGDPAWPSTTPSSSAYVPLVVGLLRVSDIVMPWGTVIVSVVVFVVVPFVAGAATRHAVVK
jgi:arsenite transporter